MDPVGSRAAAESPKERRRLFGGFSGKRSAVVALRVRMVKPSRRTRTSSAW